MKTDNRSEVSPCLAAVRALLEISRPVAVLGASVLVAMALAACDGGISGTGGPDPADTTLGPGPGGVIIDGEADMAAAPEGNAPVATDATDTSFVNNNNVTNRSDALVNLVHAISNETDSLILTNQGNTINPILPEPGLSFSEQATGYFTLLVDTHDIDIVRALDYAADINAPKIAGVNPMTLGPGTASTIVVRGSSTLADAPVQALVVGNHTTSNDSNTIELRFINAAPFFGQEGNIDIYIKPAGQEPTANDMPAFGNFGYSGNNIEGVFTNVPDGATDWIELPVGDFQITATDVGNLNNRFTTLEAITPVGGSSWTVIILDDPNGVAGEDINLLILNDGDTSEVALP